MVESGAGVLAAPNAEQSEALPLPQISAVKQGPIARRRALVPGYALALGSDATAGRFVTRAWPEILQRATGRAIESCAMPHAGLEAMLTNAEVMALAPDASLRLIELPSALNFSNPFYRVHPRRNDRFLQPEPKLTRLYPEVDFTEFTFARHMVLSLWAIDAERFAEVRQALTEGWVAGVNLLLERLQGRSLLIWWGGRVPPAPGSRDALRPGAPQLVDYVMLSAVRAKAAGLVEVVAPEAAPRRGMKADDLDLPAGAREVPGQAGHAALARALMPWVRGPDGWT